MEYASRRFLARRTGTGLTGGWKTPIFGKQPEVLGIAAIQLLPFNGIKPFKKPEFVNPRLKRARSAPGIVKMVKP